MSNTNTKWSAKRAVRQIKNVILQYSDIERKVREATSNDPWPTKDSQLEELSGLTEFKLATEQIIDTICKRLLNEPTKYWRHVFKCLVLLDYIVRTGNESFAEGLKTSLPVMQQLETLTFYRFLDEKGRDQGIQVRTRALALLELLKSPEKLLEARRHALEQIQGSSTSLQNNNTRRSSLFSLQDTEKSVIPTIPAKLAITTQASLQRSYAQSSPVLFMEKTHPLDLIHFNHQEPILETTLETNVPPVLPNNEPVLSVQNDQIVLAPPPSNRTLGSTSRGRRSLDTRLRQTSHSSSPVTVGTPELSVNHSFGTPPIQIPIPAVGLQYRQSSVNGSPASFSMRQQTPRAMVGLTPMLQASMSSTITADALGILAFERVDSIGSTIQQPRE